MMLDAYLFPISYAFISRREEWNETRHCIEGNKQAGTEKAEVILVLSLRHLRLQPITFNNDDRHPL